LKDRTRRVGLPCLWQSRGRLYESKRMSVRCNFVKVREVDNGSRNESAHNWEKERIK